MSKAPNTRTITWKDLLRKQDHLISILWMLIVSGLAYLPLMGKFGYYNDDWYLMYAASAYGPNAFIDIFSVDRPGRILVMIPAYLLFGNNPLLYNISAYMFRVAGALALYWLLNILWPKRRPFTTLASLLFLVYPGFLSQPNAIDYQSHIVALAAALFSVALTVKAVATQRLVLRWILHVLSILFGWLYLSQMEWYIGFEFFRWACVFLLSARAGGAFLQEARQTIRAAYPSLLIPIFFLTWRLFFFESERGATNTDIQFELIRQYPIQTLYHWSVQLVQDLFDVLVSAWVIPLSQLKQYFQAWGGVLVLIGVALSLVMFNKLSSNDDRDPAPRHDFFKKSLLVGFLSAAAGLLPVVMANREVAFPFFSRYSLVSSVGVCIFLASLLVRIEGRPLRSGLTGGLLAVALLVHYANSVSHAKETASIQTFWWQVSWRVPQLAPRTTLVANYPSGVIEEDYFIWGPANLIYYPEKRNAENIQPVLFASVLNKGSIKNILARERQTYDNRKNIITYPNYRNVLIISQPAATSCVHVIDGMHPEFSEREPGTIREIGPFSETEHILLDQAPHTPPSLAFGPEPEHGWCYYYQKADLARQLGDWDTVLQLGQEAFGKNLTPQDSIEWMPFLQAYARTGDLAHLEKLAPQITASPYTAQQACQTIRSMPGLQESVMEEVVSLYCSE